MFSGVLPRFDQFRGVWGPSWGPKDRFSPSSSRWPEPEKAAPASCFSAGLVPVAYRISLGTMEEMEKAVEVFREVLS